MGGAPRIKLKIWQELGLVDFDVSALVGRSIEAAYLYVKPAGGHVLGLNGGTDLRWLTVSTVTRDWVEGRARGSAPRRGDPGATFREASYGKRDWGWPGARVWDVILGNGHSLRFDGSLDPTGDGWLRIKIDRRLVQALVSGSSHGLALMDGSTQWIANCYIKSRESGEGPFLEVIAGPPDREPPAAPTEVAMGPAPSRASALLGAALISLRVPEEAFAFEVRLDSQPVPRWQLPPPATAGTLQSLPLVDLPPNRRFTVQVAAIDTAGNRSPFVTVRGTTSEPLQVPELAPSRFQPRGSEPPRVGGLAVWALPALSKLDPVGGTLVDEPTPPDLRQKNPVWSGAEGRIRLPAAKGEIVDVQLALEGRGTDCRILVSDLAGRETIPRRWSRVWRNWHVGRQAEYAIPLSAPIDLPPADNRVAQQQLQTFTLDYFIPGHVPAGTYEGTIEVVCRDGSRNLDLTIEVFDVTLPETIHFNVELNCYQGPGAAGSPRFVASARLAHYHRATLNRVPYTHRGEVHPDWVPEIDASGRVVDWSRFDRNLGGMLDGTWFSENPRRGVPVPVLYLPFFEGWPLDFRRHYHPGEGVPVVSNDPRRMLEHDALAPPIAEAIDQQYQEIFTGVLRQFVEHFSEKGWNDTLLQMYLNNKPKYGYTLWSFDEPVRYLDWAALNFYARLLKDAVDDPEIYRPAWHEKLFREGLERDRPSFVFRADVSRPMWQGSVSDGLFNQLYLGVDAFGAPRLIRDLKRRVPTQLYNYGSCSRVDETHWKSVRWCLAAYAGHFDGVLPWQSIGGPEALERADRNALIIDAGTHGRAVASLRVHALRQGAQICELLRLLQLERGWPRETIALLLRRQLGIDAGIDRPAAAEDFLRLKEGLLQLLEDGPPPVAPGP